MRRTEQQWRALIEEQLSSGESAAKFCRDRGLSAKGFSSKKISLGYKRVLLERSGFVKVVPKQNRQPDSVLWLALGDAKLSIPSNVSPAWLGQLLKELNRAPVQ